MKRMRLVPESEYDRLMKYMDTSPSEVSDDRLYINTLENNKKKILSAADIPDDIKSILYQDLARRIITKRKIEKEKPVLVKTVNQEPTVESTITQTASEPTTPLATPILSSEDQTLTSDLKLKGKRGKELLGWLKGNDISWRPDSKEILVGGQRVPGTNIEQFVDKLLKPHTAGPHIHGFSEVKDFLSSNQEEDSKYYKRYFKKRASTIYSPKVTRSRSKINGSSRRQLHTNWETY